jgi:hypothetical protein
MATPLPNFFLLPLFLLCCFSCLDKTHRLYSSPAPISSSNLGFLL